MGKKSSPRLLLRRVRWEVGFATCCKPCVGSDSSPTAKPTWHGIASPRRAGSVEKRSNAGSIACSMWQCSPTVCTGDDASAPASPNTSGPFIRPWHSLATCTTSSALACSEFVRLFFFVLYSSLPSLPSSALTLARIRLLAGPFSYPLPSCSLLGALLRQTGQTLAARL